VHTASLRTPIGTLTVVADDTHVLSIGFKKSTATKKGKTSKILSRALTELDEYFRGKRITFTFPMKAKGTQFQRKVWGTMSKIGHGRTMSYADVAKAIGLPKSFRAVANACGRNPLSIVIPCHRVTASNGEMGGYSGGTSKKKWLLTHERGKKLQRKRK